MAKYGLMVAFFPFIRDALKCESAKSLQFYPLPDFGIDGPVIVVTVLLVVAVGPTIED